MKKVIKVLVVILGMTNVSHAQQKPAKKTMTPAFSPTSAEPYAWIGIFVGPNLNDVAYHDKNVTVRGENTGFHGGIFYQRKIFKSFALQPSLLLSMRGGKITDVDSTINAKLINIELPITVLWLYKQLMLGAGPNFSYGIHSRFETNEGSRDAYDPAQSLERTLKRFEFGGNFVIGYSLKKVFVVMANFSPGCANIYKGDRSAPSTVRARTSLFGLSIGYLIPID